MHKRDFLWIAAAFGALVIGGGAARAADRLPVVASFSILADMVRQVGGERVDATALVGPDADAHSYQPTPADAKALSTARVLVVNGLAFEGWTARLQRSSGFKGVVVTASAGVTPRPANAAEQGDREARHGTADPHAWQSVANGKRYVANILEGLIKADPEGRAAYAANAAGYLALLDALEAETRAALGSVPASRRKLITSHDAFGYFAAAYGLSFVAPQGMSTESEASARDVARLIRQIKAEKAAAVFVENISDARLIEQIGRETGAKVGGVLFSDALSGPDGRAPTYVDMIRHNVRAIVSALNS